MCLHVPVVPDLDVDLGTAEPGLRFSFRQNLRMGVLCLSASLSSASSVAFTVAWAYDSTTYIK